MMLGLDRDECKKLKAKRRTLKNRGYAASCRHKRDNEEGDLQGEKMELEVRLVSTCIPLLGSHWNKKSKWSCYIKVHLCSELWGQRHVSSCIFIYLQEEIDKLTRRKDDLER